MLLAVVAGFSFRRSELNSRRDSLFNITAIAQMEQANVLDCMSEAIVIASPTQATYINEEAWKLFNCQQKRNEC